MAVRHKSAMKQLRSSKKRNLHNTAVKSRLKTLVKKVNLAINAKDQAQIQEAMKVAVSELQRFADRNVIHKNAASRKISRLMLKANKALAQS